MCRRRLLPGIPRVKLGGILQSDSNVTKRHVWEYEVFDITGGGRRPIEGKAHSTLVREQAVAKSAEARRLFTGQFASVGLVQLQEDVIHKQKKMVFPVDQIRG